MFDGNRGGEPVDMIDVGLFHHRQELPGVGRQRFDVAPLPFGVQVSKASEDLPEPESPVITTSLSLGMVKSIFFRLWVRAPLTKMESMDFPAAELNGQLSAKLPYRANLFDWL